VLLVLLYYCREEHGYSLIDRFIQNNTKNEKNYKYTIAFYSNTNFSIFKEVTYENEVLDRTKSKEGLTI